jgi:hypothetical protein
MRSFGVLLCILGVFVAAGAIAMYLAGSHSIGIACMVLGGGLFITGVMIFMADLAIRLTKRKAKVALNFEFFRLRVNLHASIGSPEVETDSSWIDRWLDRGLSEIGTG